MNENIINCIPVTFNTNILHQLFDYKITFVNSQLEKKFKTQKLVLKVILNIFGIQKII